MSLGSERKNLAPQEEHTYGMEMENFGGEVFSRVLTKTRISEMRSFPMDLSPGDARENRCRMAPPGTPVFNGLSITSVNVFRDRTKIIECADPVRHQLPLIGRGLAGVAGVAARPTGGNGRDCRYPSSRRSASPERAAHLRRRIGFTGVALEWHSCTLQLDPD